VPKPKKLKSSKWKNRHESAQKTKPKHLLYVTSVIFRSNKVRSVLETHSTKAISVAESNNAGVWEPSLQSSVDNGVLRQSPRRCGILQLFSKNTHFRHVLVQISA